MIRKFALRNFVLAACAVSLAATASFCSAELSQEEKDAGFKSLFDGKTLDGWVGATTGYEVQDGAITCIPSKGGNLYTAGEYGNFVFRFEFKLTPGANNGLGLRAPLEGDAAYVGMESQILDDTAEAYKNIKPWQHHGSIYGVVPAKTGFLKPVGEWNTEEVTCNGRKVKIVLNGETIVDADLDEATKDGTIDGNKHPGLERTKGHIGFLGHGHKVQFRNIRIKPLD
jgi:Domain of Unknown Function (DUF1080)